MCRPLPPGPRCAVPRSKCSNPHKDEKILEARIVARVAAYLNTIKLSHYCVQGTGGWCSAWAASTPARGCSTAWSPPTRASTRRMTTPASSGEDPQSSQHDCLPTISLAIHTSQTSGGAQRLFGKQRATQFCASNENDYLPSSSSTVARLHLPLYSLSMIAAIECKSRYSK